MDDNCCTFIGRLVQDVVYEKNAQDGQSRATGRLIINREGNKNEYDTIPFVAWGITADNIYKYTSQGKEVQLRGPIRTNSVKDASGKYTNYFELLILHVSFGADAGYSKAEKKVEAVSNNPNFSKKAAEALIARVRKRG